MATIFQKCQGLTSAETKILTMKFPRELNDTEQKFINNKLKQVHPDIFFFSKTYNDKVIDFISNPSTKALMFCCLMILLLLVLKEFNILKFMFNIKYIEIYVSAIIILGIVIYNQQKNLNENIMWMLKRLPEHPTYGDYLAKLPKPDTHKSIFTTVNTILLTTLIAGIIDLTRKNPMLTKIFN